LHINRELWLLQYLYKQQGLPESTGDNKIYIPSENLSGMFSYVNGVLMSQIDYQCRSHGRFEQAHKIMHRMTYVFFCFTVFGVLLHFFFDSPWLLILTAAFPALAAGLHGISSRLEFSRLASQSVLTEARLRSLEMALRKLENEWMEEKISPFVCWMRLRVLTVAAAKVMSRENTQWAELLSHNTVDIPA